MVRNLQIGRCEIPDCPDTAGHKAVTGLLGTVRRYCNDADEDIVMSAECSQPVHGINGFSGFRPSCTGCNIKSRQYIQPLFFKTRVIQQRTAQLPCPHHHSTCLCGKIQISFNILQQFLPAPSGSAPSRAGHLRQIFPDLHIPQPQRFGNCRGGNDLRILRQRFQIVQIDGQPFQLFSGNIRQLHVFLRVSKHRKAPGREVCSPPGLGSVLRWGWAS